MSAPSLARAESFLSGSRLAPHHPTLITADYKGQTLPVVGAAGELAEIEVDGKLKRLFGTPNYAPIRAVSYAPGFILFSDIAGRSVTTYLADAHRTSDDYHSDKVISKDADFQCSILSDTALDDGYLVVLFFQLGADNLPVPGKTRMGFRAIGALPAGKKAEVRLARSYVAAPGERFYSVPMVFTHGREVRSDQSPELDTFFRREEMARHTEFLLGYAQKFPGANHAAVPYLRVALTLPPGTAASSLPPDLKVRFLVTENGEVDGVTFTPALDPMVARWIQRDLDGWLFLPRLAFGAPATTVINMPLSFQ